MQYIYFARSLRGADTNPKLYKAIEKTIRECGYRPQFDIPVKIDRTILDSETYIYTRDLAWLDKCDALVAEVTYASHGVGYEIAYAHFVRKIPILCIANQRDNDRVSAMIAGYHKVSYYRDENIMKALIRSFIAHCEVTSEKSNG